MENPPWPAPSPSDVTALVEKTRQKPPCFQRKHQTWVCGARPRATLLGSVTASEMSETPSLPRLGRKGLSSQVVVPEEDSPASPPPSLGELEIQGLATGSCPFSLSSSLVGGFLSFEMPAIKW